mmetsp:Transcript_10286/g.30961  ORF Transcript_10286/g.30961 Transcript_10286/m.30961 type:complete len:328 (+) Transcript_10286:4689-5672(+)
MAVLSWWVAVTVSNATWKRVHTSGSALWGAWYMQSQSRLPAASASLGSFEYCAVEPSRMSRSTTASRVDSGSLGPLRIRLSFFGPTARLEGSHGESLLLPPPLPNVRAYERAWSCSILMQKASASSSRKCRRVPFHEPLFEGWKYVSISETRVCRCSRATSPASTAPPTPFPLTACLSEADASWAVAAVMPFAGEGTRPSRNIASQPASMLTSLLKTLCARPTAFLPKGGSAVAEPTGRRKVHPMWVYSRGNRGPQSTSACESCLARFTKIFIHQQSQKEQLATESHMSSHISAQAPQSPVFLPSPIVLKGRNSASCPNAVKASGRW